MFLNDKKGTSVHRLLPLDVTDVSSFPVSRPGAAVGGTGGVDMEMSVLVQLSAEFYMQPKFLQRMKIESIIPP